MVIQKITIGRRSNDLTNEIQDLKNQISEDIMMNPVQTTLASRFLKSIDNYKEDLPKKRKATGVEDNATSSSASLPKSVSITGNGDSLSKISNVQSNLSLSASS